MQHQAAEADAKIRIEHLPDIVSDRLAIEQIFSNLIDNALKYLKGGVPGDIVIRGRTKLGFAIFEVADNGAGSSRRIISGFSSCSAAPAPRTSRARA